MPKIYSSKYPSLQRHSSSAQQRSGTSALERRVSSAQRSEFGFLGRNLASGGGVRTSAAIGLKKLRMGKRFAKKSGKKLLTNPGAIGKASRYGYKKAQQGINLGNRLGSSVLSTGRSQVRKIKRFL